MSQKIKLLIAVIAALDQSAIQAQLVINTVAGGSLPNNVGAANASFGEIIGLAVGPSGSLYAATWTAIYKIAPNGILTRYAGTGWLGVPVNNKPAPESPLIQVIAIAVDSSENLYILQQSGNAGPNVQRVSPITGLMQTVLSGAEAATPVPGSLAVDNQGRLLISRGGAIDSCDLSNNTCQRVAGTRQSGFYQGEGGPAVQATLGGVLSASADALGNVYISDSSNYRIYKVDIQSKVITTVAGGGANTCTPDGTAAVQIQTNTHYFAVDSNGDLLIPEPGCYRVRKLDHLTGTLKTIVGTGSSGFAVDGTPASAAAIVGNTNSWPVASDLRTGDMYMVDNRRVRRVSALNPQISTVAGTGDFSYSGDGGISTGAQLYGPRRIAVDAPGNYYIADTFNNRIRRVDSKTGVISTVAGTGVAAFNGDGLALSTNIDSPSGLAFDQSGSLLFSDTGNNRIRRLLNGSITTIAGNGKAASTFPASNILIGDGGPALNAILSQPSGIAVDRTGNLFIVDTGNQRIRRIGSDQNISTVAGNGQVGYSGDGGPATNAALSSPSDVAVDAEGNLLVADTWNFCVRKVSPGNISTFAGVCNAGGSVAYIGDNLPATSAHLDFPSGVIIDLAGNVIISDTGSSLLLQVGPDRITTKIAGTNVGNLAIGGTYDSQGFSGDGGLAYQALLFGPTGLAIDVDGGLLVADSGNNRIRRMSAASQPSLSVGGVTNGASFFAGLVAGSIATVFGDNLTTMVGIQQATSIPLPLQLAGTSVELNGSHAPLLSVSNLNGQQQVNFQVPWELAGQRSAILTISNFGAFSQPLTVTVLTSQPGLFVDTNGNIAGLHGLTNAPITPTNPAAKGEVISIFATGIGALTSHPPTGEPGAAQNTISQPVVAIDGLNAQVQYSGLAPGLVGVYQLNVTIPVGISSGTVSVMAAMNGASSNKGALPVQ